MVIVSLSASVGARFVVLIAETGLVLGSLFDAV